ncbi:MAG: sensor histidine kinase [Thermaerobacter sp.]|nr:sensor histidine kinase [Thermaerobacter sp.]
MSIPPPEYRYRPARLPKRWPADQWRLLADARSAVIADIPGTAWQLRLETASANGFMPGDQEILTTFAWQPGSLLEQDRLHRESVASAQSTERRQLAADLHDAVSQRLFSAQLLLNNARLLIPDANNGLAMLIDRVQVLVREAQIEMRQMAGTLRRAPSRALVDRLQERVATLNLAGIIRFTLNAPLKDPVLSPPEHDGLSAVIDEALQNILRHSRATTAHIAITPDGNGTRITISDNGQGYDPQAVRRGLGSSTMTERLQAIGASLAMHTACGAGTQLDINLPAITGHPGPRREGSEHE